MYLVSPKRVFKGNKAWEEALPEISKLTKFPLIVGRSSSTNSLRQKIVQDLNLYNISIKIIEKIFNILKNLY